MRKSVLGILLATAPLSLPAKTLEYDQSAAQSSYAAISEDLISTIDYRALGPAEATGIVGFGVGVVSTYVPFDSDVEWADFTGGGISGLAMIGVQVTKGLPLGLDVGAFYTTVPDTDASVYGGEVRYAILEGSTVSPALALRASYVTLEGIDSFDAESAAVDLSLSKGFALITPYVGVGYVFGETSDPDGSGSLTAVDVEDTKAFIGARISLGLLEFTPELGQVGDNITYSLRAGFSFSL